MREPTEAVAPVSAMTRGTSSSFLARMAAAAFFSRASRSSTGVAAQAGKASRAAARGGLGVVHRGVGGLAHHLLGGRVDDVVGAVAGVDPLAPDQQLCLVLGDLSRPWWVPFRRWMAWSGRAVAVDGAVGRRLTSAVVTTGRQCRSRPQSAIRRPPVQTRRPADGCRR